MEAKTMTPEGAEFMRDILAGDEKTLANYINTVGIEKACDNIYKLAEYSNDLTIQVEDADNGNDTIAELNDAKAEIERLKTKYLLYDHYRRKCDELEGMVKAYSETIKSLNSLVALISK